MAWGTSQLAQLAGTTLKAVRHYHKLELLDEPARTTNGYKQYQVAHLIRLLQITRLAELGVPLAQIASMGHADKDPDEAIRVLDAELDATVERLQRIRGELGLILRHRAPADLPAGFSHVASELSASDRSMVMIYSRVFDQTVMDELRRLLHNEQRTDADDEFDALPSDADRPTRRQLGERLAPSMSRQMEEYPGLHDPGANAPQGSAFTSGTVVEALRDLYNLAQLEVLYRARLISTGATEELDALEAAQDAALDPPPAR